MRDNLSIKMMERDYLLHIWNADSNEKPEFKPTKPAA
jgi:hypothetical protein